MENVRVGRVWEKIRPDLDFECEQRKEVILFYVKHMPEKELFPLNRLVFFLDSVSQIAREDHSKELKMRKHNKYIHDYNF